MDKNSNSYHFVVATPDTEVDFRAKSPIQLFFDKASLLTPFDSTVIYENKQGLPEVYNKFITPEFKDQHIIFVHDDVLIQDLFWHEKLDIAFEKFDIVGLAGTKKIKIESPIKAWHMMCDREDMVGEVTHAKDKVSWTSVFGASDSRALVLDGLFLAVNVARLLETNTKMDENFGFHHYDMSFCINANRNKLKMGVYPVSVIHFGLGDSMNSEEWAKSAELFKTNYCDGK